MKRALHAFAIALWAIWLPYTVISHTVPGAGMDGYASALLLMWLVAMGALAAYGFLKIGESQ